VVADDATQVLHHGERKRSVRWGQGGWKRHGLAAHRGEERRPQLGGKLGRGAAILASEAGGLSLGRTGEAAACLSSGERERTRKGEGAARRRVGAGEGAERGVVFSAA
jgi:hypothetical protein